MCVDTEYTCVCRHRVHLCVSTQSTVVCVDTEYTVASLHGGIVKERVRRLGLPPCEMINMPLKAMYKFVERLDD